MQSSIRVYWDADVFLSYINGHADRVPVIEQLLTQASESRDYEIVTSAFTVAEVAFAQLEKDAAALEDEMLARIDSLWADRSAVQIVDLFLEVAVEARTLVREAAVHPSLRLKPKDGVHIATAKLMNVAELHSYDKQVQAWSPLVDFPIFEPYTPTPRLTGLDEITN